MIAFAIDVINGCLVILAGKFCYHLNSFTLLLLHALNPGMNFLSRSCSGHRGTYCIRCNKCVTWKRQYIGHQSRIFDLYRRLSVLRSAVNICSMEEIQLPKNTTSAEDWLACQSHKDSAVAFYSSRAELFMMSAQRSWWQQHFTRAAAVVGLCSVHCGDAIWLPSSLSLNQTRHHQL